MFFGAVISVLGYLIGIYCRKKISVLNPLLIAIVLTIVVIKALDIDYETYNSGAKYISYLLTPATVCLAIPLYRQINVLKSHAKEVFIGILAGVIASMGSILLMAYLFSLTHEQYVTLLPKSITTAIGMGVSEELGGIQTITIAVIIITGVFGNIIAEGVLKIFRIKEPVAKGLAIGTASHAIGTAKALEIGETEGAMSSLAVAVAGLMTVATASFFASLL
jgi:predicted murein hydrolase (TIGR00659 family)